VAHQTFAPHKVPHPDPLPTTGEGIGKERNKERELRERARGEFHLPGGSFFWGYAEAFYEFDYFVCDVFFFAVDCDHVIALV
jgi:hypothetical protein